MMKKRASLEDQGEEILGIERGGKGADILFGGRDQAEPGARPQDVKVSEEGEPVAGTAGYPEAEVGLPQGEADLGEASGAEVEPQEVEMTGVGAVEYPVAVEGMPQGEADLDEALDLDSVLDAEAQAAEGPALATTPAGPAPEVPEPITPPPVIERPPPAPYSVPLDEAEPALEPAAGPPPGVGRPEPAPPPSTAPPGPTPPVGQPSVAATTPPPEVAPSPPAPRPAVAPPSTETGAPDHSVPRPPHYFDVVAGDYDLLTGVLSADNMAAAALTSPPVAVKLTQEEREELLKRQSVEKKLSKLDEAIDKQYERIVVDNVSVNKWITDYCHNLLAEARIIVLHRQVESLAKAEWNVEQVRARLDRAEESSRKSIRYAWPITLWGVLWFGLFVYLIFNPTFFFDLLRIPDTGDPFIVPEIFLRTMYFAGVGAVAAVFYHLFKYVQERSFDSQFALSYAAKPFMGMIIGSIIFLTVFVLTQALRLAPLTEVTATIETGAEGDVQANAFQTTTDLMYLALLYFVAMAAGFKENLAFDLLNRVIRSVLGIGPEEEEVAEPPPGPAETETQT